MHERNDYVPMCVCANNDNPGREKQKMRKMLRFNRKETNEFTSIEKNRIQEGKRQIQVYFILVATAQFRRLHPDSMPTEAKATPPLREVLRSGHQRVPLLPILF